MYNESRKKEFVRSITTSLNTAKNYEQLFSKTEKYEEALGKDVCEFSSEEGTLNIVNNFKNIRNSSNRTRLSMLSTYIEWCIREGIPNAFNWTNDVGNNTLSTIKSLMVSGPIHLDKCMDAFLSPASDRTIDCIYRCYYWMAFAGIKEEDIYKVKSSDVNLDLMVIRVGTHDYPIYREAIESFYNAKVLDDFNYYHPNYKKMIFRHRYESDLLMRGIKANVNIPTMQVELSRRQKAAVENGKTTVKLNYHKVFMSGIFYRMNEIERAGIKPDFRAAACMEADGKEYKVKYGHTLNSKICRIEREYEIDYALWKEAFRT